MNNTSLRSIIKKIYKVLFLPRVDRRLDRLPHNVLSKPRVWIRAVELFGLPEVRKNPGFHDEPLHGKRAGQRSIRLNRSYRAIYVENENAQITLVSVIEVSKHDY